MIMINCAIEMYYYLISNQINENVFFYVLGEYRILFAVEVED